MDIVNGVPDEYVAASRKVLGADQVTEFESQARSMCDQMGRPGRMPSFLPKLAGDAEQAIGSRHSVGGSARAGG